MFTTQKMNGKSAASFSLLIFRVLCAVAATLYLFFGFGFRLLGPYGLDPLSMTHRIILAAGYLLVLIGSYLVPWVKRYIGDFMMVMVLGSFAHLAFVLAGMDDQTGTIITWLMIIPLFNALLYHYRRLLAANLAFIAILGFSTIPSLHAHSIWLMVVAIIITAASYLMALARRASTERYEILFAQSPMGIALHQLLCDSDGKPIDFRYLEVNNAFEQLTGHLASEVVGRKASELFPTSYKANLEVFSKVALTGNSVDFEVYSTEFNKYLEIKAYQPKQMQFITITKDITRRRKAEENLKHSMTHDWLTGLYSRRFFEDELERLARDGHFPLSLVIADVNGLKLVNDTLGHQTGDILLKKAGEVLLKAAREKDVVARWGGDEFAMLLPDTTFEQVSRISSRIQEIIDTSEEDTLTLSISFGYATATDASIDIADTIKHAEDHMYRRKGLQARSSRKSLVQSLQTVLQNKSQEMVRRSNNVQLLTEAFGRKLGMEDKALHELTLLAAIHDIGNVAIAEAVISKPGPLTEEEWETMRRHPEIGYRIALASLDLEPVAEGILHHHEWWDGTGYPHGLKGMAIPLQARVLAITDSFCAMITDRAHAKARTITQAKLEIRQGVANHFDPGLVDIFLEMLEDETLVAKLRL
ncbi:MAG: PAS domain S-box protein [Spirochaetae bacterium HGW-Spirochaetae-8]|nr:MAG: PAS domain S-box protein [Spirochaetae bacterium HGW-Spirochaetae-8]